MHNQELDCRGLACPQPVVETKKRLDELQEGVLTVLVDNETAKNNLLKLAGSRKLAATVSTDADCFTINIKKTKINTDGIKEELPTTLLLTADTMGRGSDELGGLLIRSFFYALAEHDQTPAAVYLVNSAVKLACEDSHVIDSLEKLVERGTTIHSCGLCLDYFKLKEKLVVGEITNMYAIVERVMSGQMLVM